MKHYHRIPLMLCSFCAVSLFIIAQNNTNLPTSMYGVGDTFSRGGGATVGRQFSSTTPPVKMGFRNARRRF